MKQLMVMTASHLLRIVDGRKTRPPRGQSDMLPRATPKETVPRRHWPSMMEADRPNVDRAVLDFLKSEA